MPGNDERSVVALTSGDEAFDQVVQARLEAVENALADAVQADTAFVTSVASHILQAGGKRFRPRVVILASQLYPGADEREVINAALVMELVHLGSLYHDDVMDEAVIRRGVPSVNARYGNSLAIMVGDFLFARAASIVAGLGSRYVGLQANTFARLVQGQIAEMLGPQPDDDPATHYVNVIADKTGSLIASSAVFGGLACRAPEEVLGALSQFGEEIGMVFQLSDDLLDITSDFSGKEPGTDLREGVLTLPTLLLKQGDRPEDEWLRREISAPIPDRQRAAEVLAALRVHPVMDQARDLVIRRAELARSYLAPLPEGAAKRALAALCDEVISRSR